MRLTEFCQGLKIEFCHPCCWCGNAILLYGHEEIVTSSGIPECTCHELRGLEYIFDVLIISGGISSVVRVDVTIDYSFDGQVLVEVLC